MREFSRSTLIVHGRLAMRTARLSAAREGRNGLQVMSFEQAAVRLAGGFTQPIDAEILRSLIQAVLPTLNMGELERIKALPGMVSAAADSLHKVWHAGIDLALRESSPRIEAMAHLEAAVLERLPPGMLRPVDIVAAATARLRHAPAVLGAVEISGLTELEPCWRPLLKSLATIVPVQWTAGPRAVPDWLAEWPVTVTIAAAASPNISVVSAATAYHEAVEALRWVRSLLASGVPPADIAIASASTAEYDDHFLALRADADLDLHFVHGVRSVTTHEGQAAAALADIVVRGLSRAAFCRLAVLCRTAKPFSTMPAGWLRILPADAPLTNLAAWARLLTRLQPQDWPDEVDRTETLRAAVHLLAQRSSAAAELGEVFLKGRAHALWQKALLAGPAAAMDSTLGSLKQDDGPEACVSVAWMPASALAASPRPFVRLIGLNSSRWPRGLAEDRLIPDHIIATRDIDPLPINLADRRDFRTIVATTEKELVLSRSRRDSEGRRLGRSPLLTQFGEEIYLRRHAVPAHAFSETDRLMARPAEFALERQAIGAMSCWLDWHRPDITPHDGLVRNDHPLLLAVLNRRHSASSLKLLLRNPIGYLWRYALRWEAPETGAEPLTLEPLELGKLAHQVLDLGLRELEGAGGLSSADAATITTAVQRASECVAADWESAHAIPPPAIWHKTLDDVRSNSVKALSFRSEGLPGARAYSEVPFGGIEPKSTAAVPWDITAPVVIPGTDVRIGGYIDRLDVTQDGSRALVIDYKTGRPPDKPFRLDGGDELQRCLYAFAVRALLGDNIEIRASLLYPHADVELPLEDPGTAMSDLATYLRVAVTGFAAGGALPGPDAAGSHDDFAFALPANAAATYSARKHAAVLTQLADLAPLWKLT